MDALATIGGVLLGLALVVFLFKKIFLKSIRCYNSESENLNYGSERLKSIKED